MRRLTWMRYNHSLLGTKKYEWQDDSYSIVRAFKFVTYLRQPMQRTEYYMPWGTVTVDELHRMD